MGSFLIRGIFIGLLFGAPAGAVGAMTAQRTLNYGIRAGLLTGLGASAADCFYACIGAFGLTFISDFLMKYQEAVYLAGGSLILGMGIQLLKRKKEIEIQNTCSAAGRFRMFFSSFTVGITNPAAIITFLFAFSWFGISGQTGLLDGSGLVCGVFIGTYFWWGALSGLTALLKKKAKSSHLHRINRLFGIVFILLGTAVLFRTVMG